MAQKPKRVGQLANVGAKVRNINETAKFSATFYCLTTFLLGLKGVDLIKWEVSHGTISPAKAAYLRESSGTGSLQSLSP